MNISKLTITPVISEANAFIVKNPSSKTAGMLIKERLQSSQYNKKTIKPKMPKFLRGFVNPKTYVGKSFDLCV